MAPGPWRARGYDVVRYDARGHGDSDPGPVGAYDYEHAGRRPRPWSIEAAGGLEARPLLVGHSMGAHTIVNPALRDPDRSPASS